MDASERCTDIEERLKEGLSTATVGHPLLVCRSVASTNDVAKDLALKGAPDGLTVLSIDQTAGRGRRGRTWVSFGEKAVYMSVVLKPEWPAADVTWLGVLGGVAVAGALHELGVRNLSIKWPNDVLVGSRKIAGVLVEPRLGEEDLAFAILGMGVNVGQQSADWPEDLRTIATSCREQGIDVTWDDVIRALVRSVDAWYAKSGDESRKDLLDAWSAWSGSSALPVLD